MENFLMMFRKVNYSNELVLCWSESKQKWGTLTESEVASNISYLDFRAGKKTCDDFIKSLFTLKYKRIIKTRGKIGIIYENIIRSSKLWK